MRVRAYRQAHGEDRAFARLARQGHVTAHHARELAGNRKAEAGSAIAPRGQGIGLAELLEQLRLLLRRHADAGVADGEVNPVASVGYLSRPQRDLALFGELAGPIFPNNRALPRDEFSAADAMATPPTAEKRSVQSIGIDSGKVVHTATDDG